MSSRLGKKQITQTHGLTDAGLRPGQGPQGQAQIRVEGHPCAVGLRACAMAAKAVSQAEAEMASDMPDRCSHWLLTMASMPVRQVLRLHAARGRSGTRVAEVVTLSVVAHKVETRGRLWLALHGGGVHVFALPKVHQMVAPAVSAQNA